MHRENDLPAIIRSDGTQYWCKIGLIHRNNDLPAVIDFMGNKFWFKYGNQYWLEN
jgi:hypothetical protein